MRNEENHSMTPEEYTAKLDRLNSLMGDDPEPETDAGRELSALADELQTYEQATWPFLYPQDESDPADSSWPDDDEPPDLEPGTP